MKGIRLLYSKILKNTHLNLFTASLHLINSLFEMFDQSNDQIR